MRGILFTTINCQYCSMMKDILEQFDNVELIDADAEENQDFCDQNNVDVLPHIQIYDGEKKVYEAISFEKMDIRKIVELLMAK